MAVGVSEAPDLVAPFDPGAETASASRIERARPGEDRLVRWTLDQIAHMIEAEVLPGEAPWILLDGLLVKKMGRNEPHITTVLLLCEALRMILPEGWHHRPESPIVLPDGPLGYPSLPEPDATLVRGEIRKYLARRPHPEDVGIVVEVADTTLRKDRSNLERYGWSAIPSVWIVNLAARNVEVYSDPSGPGDDPRYGSLRTYGESELIPVVLDGVEVGQVAVASILP